MATLEELEKRIACLEDIEAIKKLKAKYARACDEHSAELWTEVFTEDAIWEGGEGYGTHKTRDLTYKMVAKPGPHPPSLHYFVNPEITIEGNKAYARWLMLRANTTVAWTLGPKYEANDRVQWVVGYEDDEYVKVDGVWKQNKLKLTLLFQVQTPFEVFGK